MQRVSNGRLRRGFWFAPAALGIGLIVIGLLIFVYPQLLAALVAAACIMAGLSMLGIGLQMRSRVTYRRMDMPGPGEPRL